MNQTLEPTPTKDMRYDIQGIRAVGLVAVVLFHVGIVAPGGFTAIDIFYVISGFVIGQIVLYEALKTGSFDIKKFYIRRLKRIVPAILVMLAFTALPALMLTPSSYFETAAKTGISAAAMFSNIYLAKSSGANYFDVESGSNPYLHTWSLGAEWQFYVFVPFMVFAAVALTRHRSGRAKVWALRIVFGAAGLLSLLITIRTTRDDPHSMWAYYGPHTRFWEFAPGFLLATIPPLKNRLAAQIIIAIGSIGFILMFVLLSLAVPWPSLWTMIPVVVTALLIYGGGGPHPRPLITRFLTLKPLAALGDRSYSVYLWHWPMISFAHSIWPSSIWAGLIGALISIPLAFASFKYVEDPLRKANTASFFKASAIATAASIATALLFIPLLKGNSIINRSDKVVAIEQSLVKHNAYDTGCDAASPNFKRDRIDDSEYCLTKPPVGNKGRVWLTGDSQAEHLTEAFNTATINLGYEAKALTRSGCPFADVDVWINGPHRSNCREHNEKIFTQLENDKPKLLVVSSPIDYWARMAYEGKINIASLLPTGRVEPAQQAQLAAEGFRRFLERLNRLKIPVMVIQPQMEAVKLQPRRLSPAGILLRGDSYGSPIPRAEMDALLAPSRELSGQQGNGLTNVSFVSLLDAVCSSSECPLRNENGFMYRDPVHLTVAGSKLMEPLLQKKIGEALRRNAKLIRNKS